MRTTPRGWALEPESQVCIWARRPPPPPQDADCSANILELVPRTGHRAKRFAWIPFRAHPPSSQHPRLARETEAVAKPEREPGPPDTGARHTPWNPVRPRYRGNRLPAPPAAAERAQAPGVGGGPGAPSAPGRLAPGRSRAEAPRAFSLEKLTPSSPCPGRTRLSSTC